jgi:hypothetical protein
VPPREGHCTNTTGLSAESGHLSPVEAVVVIVPLNPIHGQHQMQVEAKSHGSGF